MPVINPSIFYLMDVLSDLEVLLGTLMILLIVVWGVLFCMGLLSCRKLDEFIKPLTITTIPLVLCGILVVLIPSQDTILTMLVADMITYENLELTKESAIAIIDYIVEQIKAITG